MLKKILPFPLKSWKDIFMFLAIISILIFGLVFLFAIVHAFIWWFRWGFVALFIYQTLFVFQSKEKLWRKEMEWDWIEGMQGLVLYFYLLLIYYMIKYLFREYLLINFQYSYPWER
jgi:hypothetical protein